MDDILELADDPLEVINPKKFDSIKDVINRLTEKGLNQNILIQVDSDIYCAELVMNVDPDSPMKVGQFFFKTQKVDNLPE